MLMIPLAVQAQIRRVRPEWKPDGAVIFWARFWSAMLSIPWDLTLAVLLNEGASNARKLRDSELAALQMPLGVLTIGYPVGDMTIPRGPALGPGQVLRSNVERIWDATPEAYRFTIDAPTPFRLALKGYERQALYVTLSMLKETLAESSGDKVEAARRYNGSGPRAEEYAQRASDTMDRLGA